jgi:fatty-acyl-CoA synthase
MPAHSPTPTYNATVTRLGDFATLADSLDYAATGVGGFNFYTARGELADVITWAQLREDALVVAGRLLARGLEPGERVAIVAETEADFMRWGVCMRGWCRARFRCPAPSVRAWLTASSFAGSPMSPGYRRPWRQ